MITVHHLDNSRSQRVLWLLEELEIPYEIKRYARDPKTMLAPPELAAVHPLGKAPVVTDGTRTLAESGAILEHFVDADPAGRLAPARGTEAWIRYRYWMHYAEGSAMPPLLLKLVFERIKRAKVPFFVRPIARTIADRALSSFVHPQVKLHLDWMERELAQSQWFAGDSFTAADIQMSFPIEAAEARVKLGPERPRLRAFLDQIRARPAYQRAVERGGTFQLLG